MEIIWPFILSSLAGLSTILGSLVLFLPVKRKDEFITFSISFSLSIMIMVSLFDLIPAALPNLGRNVLYSLPKFIIFFSMGVVLVHIMNRLVEREKGSNNLYKLGILSFLALVLHNFPEGILTFLSTYSDFNLGLKLCLAISLHNIPEGISIAVPIYYGTKSRWKAIKMTILSGLAEPLGALVAFMLLKDHISSGMISLTLVLVAGIMISLSIDKMLPEALNYKKKKSLYIGLIIGIITVLLSIFI